MEGAEFPSEDEAGDREMLEMIRELVNEGVELCKMFGTVEGHRYVNGVLDKLAKDRRTPEIASTE